jgi:cytochrome c peroxidase
VAPLLLPALGAPSAAAEIGREVSVERHLQDGEEFDLATRELVAHGKLLFQAVWTDQEGRGRPQTKGVGAPLSDPGEPLAFPRNFNRVSAPDANSCAGCHNVPRAGGGGDIVANVFVLGQRFDFASFDGADATPTKGSVDELGNPATLQTIADERNTLGMFGSGFIEMLARQMTEDLIAIRDAIPPGGSALLESKGVSFGTLARGGDGSWDTSAVEGLPDSSLGTTGPGDPPNLILRAFHQAGAVVSVREFTNNAFNHHHGMQSTERFGVDEDPDGDGFANELTRADLTAAALFQATLAVPGRVIPDDPEVEQAVLIGEQRFEEIGCTGCHVSELPLDDEGWIFTEPNPFNPSGNLQPGDAAEIRVDLTSRKLDLPRLELDKKQGVVWVPAYTDLKLHDITSGPDDPNREPLNMHFPAGSAEFFDGNGRFLTRKLWGVANEPPFFHHGKYTTLRQAIEAHHGEAESSQQAWQELSSDEQAAIIEFLKTLQVLPEGTRHRIVNQNGRPKAWPPGPGQLR